MGDDAPFFHRDEAAWEGPKYTLIATGWTSGYVKAEAFWQSALLTVGPDPLNHWTVFVFSVLKKYYKNIALGIGNLTLEGAHLTPYWMTMVFTSSSAVVAVSSDIF